ncbi:site-specific integrase [Microbulbifer sp. THAF38]|uniref:tyrosine-type recombinase/integrase n=1 Tax=Microbulbifer sp. THAF38 TaxID=2587856 RepID=UPI0012A9E265|nr:site-specific integrase [Microbulbifer sp. THAF38]QFT53987.1 Putative prophage CPS-53 integrase [Microbulbifer sp. THAF38]
MSVKNDKDVRALPARENAYTKGLGDSLLVRVKPNGTKSFEYPFKYAGKSERLYLGTFPQTTVTMARQEVIKAKAALVQGINPAERRRALKAEARQAKQKEKAERNRLKERERNTLRNICELWLAAKEGKSADRSLKRWNPSTANKARLIIRKHLYPLIGDRPIAEIRRKELKDYLTYFNAGGGFENGRKIANYLSQIFEYSVDNEFREDNPALRLGVVAPATETQCHRPAPENTSELQATLLAMESARCSPTVSVAMRITPYLFLRTSEICKMRWQDLDLAKGLWEIPSDFMKVKKNGNHIVPLSKTVIKLIRTLEPFRFQSDWVFPNGRDTSRHMTNNTVRMAMRRSGIEGASPASFRASAKTLRTQLGLNRDAVELERIVDLQLHHSNGDKYGKAYDRFEYLKERTEFMLAWSHYLDSLKQPAGVTFIHS